MRTVIGNRNHPFATTEEVPEYIKQRLR